MEREKKADTTDRTDSVESAHVVEEEGEVDAVWGAMTENSPNYKNLGWMRATVLMTKSQIGLGVLAIPAVLDTFGLVPGILIIVAVAILTTWSDYVVVCFKKNHPEVYTMADVGFIMFGPVGREVLGFCFWLLMTATAGSGLLSVSISFNAMSEHGTCTMVFVAVGAIVNILVSLVQTLDKISWIGWIGLVSLLSSIITLVVAVAVQDRPPGAPTGGTFVPDVHVIGHPGFVDAINAISVVIFAYAGTPNYFGIISEMSKPKDRNKAVFTCQAFVTALYLIIGCVVYHYCGSYISSPALGSAGPLMKKICYGLALPSLFVTCILYTHLPAKYVFVRLLKGSRHLSENTVRHRLIWFACVTCNCIISFIIATAIPFFGDLLSLIGALLGSLICIQTEGVMWIYDNKDRTDKKTWKYRALLAWAILVTLLGTFAQVAGTYASVIAINDDIKDGLTTQPFSCADNSN
ncbi:hypothetical protein P7C73_g1136, partial [Tremellales sp. Uapishka_1]